MANAILHGTTTRALRVFDGKTLTAGLGPVDQREVKDGAIVCKPHKGGTICHSRKNSRIRGPRRYKLRLAATTPAIRYRPGDTACVGMCEAQVLDDRWA